ncbi:MAG: rRNA maturation RNase YbeY [Candidatus Omnitrophica bacterium]|nr:rRNA maturation RNase YbeY [Candidatus Omnitrophota bacterium]
MEIKVVKTINKRLPFSVSEVEEKTLKVLDLLKIKDGVLDVVLVSDVFIRRLNRRFLKKNNYTDVLAFGEAFDNQGHKRKNIFGEVIISVDAAKRFAKRYGQRTEREFYLYLIHGILHLLGYNDHTLKQRKTMEELQNVLLSRIIPNEK